MFCDRTRWRVTCGSGYAAALSTLLTSALAWSEYFNVKSTNYSGSKLNLFTGFEEVLFPVISYLNLALMWFGTGAYVWIGAVWDVER